MTTSTVLKSGEKSKFSATKTRYPKPSVFQLVLARARLVYVIARKGVLWYNLLEKEKIMSSKQYNKLQSVTLPLAGVLMFVGTIALLFG